MAFSLLFFSGPPFSFSSFYNFKTISTAVKISTTNYGAKLMRQKISVPAHARIQIYIQIRVSFQFKICSQTQTLSRNLSL